MHIKVRVESPTKSIKSQASDSPHLLARALTTQTKLPRQEKRSVFPKLIESQVSGSSHLLARTSTTQYELPRLELRSHSPPRSNYDISSTPSSDSGKCDLSIQQISRLVTRGVLGIMKPNPRYALFVVACEVAIPKSFKSALLYLDWKTTMKIEFDALLKNKTLTLIPRDPKDNIINNKQVFKVKQKEDRSIERYKVCLLANDMKQIEGIDYSLTFSPFFKAISICLILTIAISRNLEMRQNGISNAFLHGKLDERIVVSQPKGFEDPSHHDYVSLFHHSLYGLK